MDPDPTSSQVPGELDALAENVTGDAGSVLVSGMMRWIIPEPCVTVSSPNPAGTTATSSEVLLTARVTPISSEVALDPEL